MISKQKWLKCFSKEYIMRLEKRISQDPTMAIDTITFTNDIDFVAYCDKTHVIGKMNDEDMWFVYHQGFGIVEISRYNELPISQKTLLYLSGYNRV